VERWKRSGLEEEGYQLVEGAGGGWNEAGERCKEEDAGRG
jgi:hypothetical protein